MWDEATLEWSVNAWECPAPESAGVLVRGRANTLAEALALAGIALAALPFLYRP